MMHVAIPTSLSVTDPSNNGSTYDAFKIYVNGAYHCTLRYSQLLRLHETITKEYGDIDLPEFPPKRLKLIMTSKQKIERREALQQYLRAVCQHVVTMNSRVVNEFFLEAQKESALENKECENVGNEFPVFLLDGSCRIFTCRADENTSAFMRRYGEAARLQSQNVPCFGLFIVRKSASCPYEIVRWLKDFESPVLTLYALSRSSTTNGKVSYKLVVRKCFWDLAIEKVLLRDRAAMKILYAQALAEVMNWKIPSVLGVPSQTTPHWCQVPEDDLRQLRELKEQQAMQEYLSICSSQSRYGFVYFEPCTSDLFATTQTVWVAAGNRQLLFLHKSQSDALNETVFRVTRIRRWKLSNQDSEEAPNFSFEYLLNRNRLEWITVHSTQAIIMSMCLQSMVDEIVRCRDVSVFGGETSTNSTGSPTSSDSGVSSSFGSVKSKSFAYESFGELGRGKRGSGQMTNEAFNMITDDDL